MALTDKSLFLYGYQISEFNASLDFRIAPGGPVVLATLKRGFYSLTGLMIEISRAMRAADPFRIYEITADRTVAGGLEHRVRIETDGTHLELLFGSGPRVASSVGPLLGFSAADRTGALFYDATTTSGTAFVTDRPGYNYLSPELHQGQQGVTNISANGTKEAVVFAPMLFFQVQFKYITRVSAIADWSPLMRWMTLQRSFEFTPEVSSPELYYDATLESTPEDAKGMRFKLNEMLPAFPNLHDTGLMKFRLNA